jgi:dephospho-CoA kinase
MKIIGITGCIASGKSTVAKIFTDYGAKTISADLIATNIVQPKKKVWKEIVKEFGNGILNSDQTINREKLGSVVFSDSRALKKLNRITHPLIVETIHKEIAQSRKNKETLVVVDAALLGEFEKKKPFVDILIVVKANIKTRRQRLILRNKLSIKEANQRISAQKDLLDSLKRVDYVIDGSASLKKTKEEVFAIIREILPDDQRPVVP